MQKMPWDEDWSQPEAAPRGGGYPTIMIPRDPRQVARENDAAARAAVDQQLRLSAATRDAVRFSERNKPNLPAGYTMGPDGKTAVRIAGLPPEKGSEQPGKVDLDSIRAEAIDKIRLARTLQQRSRDGWFTTGFGASTVGRVGGTGAYDVKQDTETLKNAGALTRIMEMAKVNGGKNPLTPLSNSDFQALASSLSNLDTSQSDSQFQNNVQRVIDLYTRAYQGAGGADLEGDLNPAKRRKQGAAPTIAPARTRPPAPDAPDRSSIVYGDSGNGGGAALATGDYKTERNPAWAGVNARVAGMLRNGASAASIRDYIARSGAPADPASVQSVLDFRRRNPGFKGNYSVNIEDHQVPTTAWNRLTASPAGTAIYGAVDASMGGLSDETTSLLGGGDLDDLNARKQAAFAENPKAALLGQAVGAIGSMSALGAAGRATGLAGRFAAPQLVGDIAFGAASGAGQTNDNRLLGTAIGATGAGGGNVAGRGVGSGLGMMFRSRPGLATLNAGRSAISRIPGMAPRVSIASAAALSPAERIALLAANRGGVPGIRTALDEAETLGVPMSLADTNPNLRELAGAAVRRSPTAASFAEDTLIPRNHGQYDRFTGAVARDLGPITNIPQQSADLMTQARMDAKSVYDRAYANPVPSTPEIDAVLGTPFGRQALGRAKTIAANERRSPDEMGLALDADGNTVLNPRPNDLGAQHLFARQELDAAQDAYRAAGNEPGSMAAARARVERAREGLRSAEGRLAAAPDPSSAASVPAYTTQTFDYVKRGMDDVLEEQRNPITGKLVLDEAGRAQNQVRGQLLSEVDRLNPDFAAARAAYAGPMASRDALARGVDAYDLHPDELGMQVATQTPEHLGQMQLGYRSALVDHAGKARDSGNPWEATLGSPISRQRLGTLYPGNQRVADLLRTRELEGGLQQTKDAVIGNSKTAGRQIMDKLFDGGGWPVALGEAGLAVLTHGATLPLAARRLAGESARDMYKLGLGARATAKADDLAPMLLTPDPAAARATLDDLMARDRARQLFVAQTRPKRLGMFGSGFGSQAAVAPLNY